MANVGGGVIVFGVENQNYTPVGLSGPRTLDSNTWQFGDVARQFCFFFFFFFLRVLAQLRIARRSG